MDEKNSDISFLCKTMSFTRNVLFQLGIKQPHTISRDYIVNLYKELRNACEREEFIVSELMTLSYELVDKGFLSTRQIFSLKYEELLITTYSIFNEIAHNRDSINELLTMWLHEEEFQLCPNFVSGCTKAESTLNAIIRVLKHLKKITDLSVDDFSKNELKVLKKEIKNIICYYPPHNLKKSKRNL